MPNSHRTLRQALAFAALAGVLIWLYLFDPFVPGSFIPCPFHAATGLDCPGCGTTRALHQALHLDFKGAFRSNPLAVLILPLFGYIIASYLVPLFSGRRIPEIRMRTSVIIALSILVVAFWIIRNAAGYPFR